MVVGDALSRNWMRDFHPKPRASVRLVCMPHAGGAAGYWFPLSAAAAPEIEVLAVQYPGRQDRRHEPCIESVETLADMVAKVLLPRVDLPVALFGHSMGALIAFEVARRLESVGTVAAALFVSGRRAPSMHRDESALLSGDDGILTDLQSFGGTDPAVLRNPDLLELILPAIRSDYRAVANYRYRPGPPFSGPVVAMAGEDDARATPEEVGAWRDHTTGAFERRVFTGAHFFLDHHVAEIAELVADRVLAQPDSSG